MEPRKQAGASGAEAARKAAILDALSRWIRQRPGLEFGNYGDVTSYRAECRSIARDKREAETLLAAVRWRDGITADDLVKAAVGAYSGRLTIRERYRVHFADGSASPLFNTYAEANEHWSARAGKSERGDGTVTPESPAIDYCTGQYWPTEYRRAVAAVLAAALWDYTREKAMPAPTNHHNSETGEDVKRYNGMRAGDWLCAHFRKEFGRGIASRWFL